MKEATRLGMNRTGAQMAPKGTPAMQEATNEFHATAGDEGEAIALRGDYCRQAERIGSVPVPGSVKGVVKSGLKKLAGKRPEVLVDKLGERLAFERAGTRLYELMTIKAQCAPGGANGGLSIERLGRIRDEEARHFRLLAAALESLGADPTAQTPGADAAAVASSGILKVLSDPRTTVGQCLEAMLTAELTDHASWELLVKLAEEGGQQELAGLFKDALAEEAEHLRTIREWVERGVLERAKA